MSIEIGRTPDGRIADIYTMGNDGEGWSPVLRLGPYLFIGEPYVERKDAEEMGQTLLETIRLSSLGGTERREFALRLKVIAQELENPNAPR